MAPTFAIDAAAPAPAPAPVPYTPPPAYSGSGPADPQIRDALELSRFAMAEMRAGNKRGAIERLAQAMRALQ